MLQDDDLDHCESRVEQAAHGLRQERQRQAGQVGDDGKIFKKELLFNPSFNTIKTMFITILPSQKGLRDNFTILWQIF